MVLYSRLSNYFGAGLGTLLTTINSYIDWSGLPNMLVYAFLGGIVGAIAQKIGMKIFGAFERKDSP